jgi:hypothetical protein
MTITFESIGSRSDAHKKAQATYRGKLAPDRVIQTREILQQLIARGSRKRKSGPAGGS